MEKSLKISIIIPVHNAENTLIRCVDSILSQGYKNSECILVENGSDDNSKALCEKLAERNKNIIFKSIVDIGASTARNVGLSVATGDIIGFCDADDFLEKNALSSIASAFINNPEVNAVFGGFSAGGGERGYTYQ